MRKMFTRLFSLTLLLCMMGFTTKVSAQLADGCPDLTLSAANVELVTTLTDVCDSATITFKVVGFEGLNAEYAFNYDGNETGGFTPTATFNIKEGLDVNIAVNIGDTCFWNLENFSTNVVDPIVILEPEMEHPSCGSVNGEVTINFSGGYTEDYIAAAGEYPYLYTLVSADSFDVNGPGFYPDLKKVSPNYALPAGTYYVMVHGNKVDQFGEPDDQKVCLTDYESITAWDTAIVLETSPAVVLDSIYHDTIDCYDGTANVTVVVSGGTGDTLFVQLWDADADAIEAADTSFSGGDVVFPDIPAGSYYAMVIDSLGCEDQSDSTIVIENPEELMFDIVITDVSCSDSTDGAIQVNILNYDSGATYEAKVVSADSTYAWVADGGDSIINITGLDPVYYALYVRDITNGCDSVAYDGGINGDNKITVQSPGEVMFATMYDSIQCYGDSTWFSIDSVTGGNGVYEYRLDSSSVVLSGWQDTLSMWLLPAGTYQVAVRDTSADGCEVSEQFTVVQATEFTFDGIETIEPICPGGNDGLIIVDVDGGSGNYKYSLDSVTWYTNNSLTAEAGTHVVYVKEMNCNKVIIDTVVVDDLDEFTVEWDESDTLTLSCYGDSTYVDIDVDWDDRGTGDERDVTYYVTQDINSVFVGGMPVDSMPNDGDDEPLLGAGTYYTWAADDYGCISSNYDTIVILQPDELIVMASVTEHATCSDDNDGVITIEAPDNYDWTNLKYVLTNTYTGASITDPDYMTDMPDSVVNVQAAAGTWYAVLYDDYCNVRSISQEMVVESFDPVNVSDTALMVTDIVCYGDSVGAFTIAAATGGSGDLVYTLYMDGKTAADTVTGYVEVTDTAFTNLKAGMYYVEVTDIGVGGCDGDWTEAIVVEEPSAFMVFTDTTDISCFGAADGLIRIELEGGNEGTPMFKLGTASWQPMVKATSSGWEKNIVITEPGDYTVWLKDTLGCPAGEYDFTIVEPPVLTVDALGIDDTTACGIQDDGMIEVTIEGGKTLVTEYEIEVAGVDTVTIPMDSVHTFINVAPGTYEVYVTEKGVDSPCTMMDSVTIGSPDTIAATVESIDDVACKDGETGVITLDITGGSGIYAVTVNGDAVELNTDMEITGLAAGEYEIIISDSATFTGQCSLTLDTVVVDEPDEYLELAATRIQDITCVEPGMFSVQATGGVGPYMYATALSDLPDHVLVAPAVESSAWQSDSIFSVTDDGTWIVWVMDSWGCVVGGEFDENDVPVNGWRVPIAAPIVDVVVDASLYDAPECNGDMTAMIVVEDADVTITVEGDTLARGYTIAYTSLAGEELATGDTLADLGADTIIVTVTDTLSGCSGVDTVVITEPELLQAELYIADGDFTCPDAVEGYIEVAVMGGTPEVPSSGSLKEKAAKLDYVWGYQYQLWQDGVLKTDYQYDNSFAVKIDHSYVVVVKDANGCTDTTNTITIDPVEPIEFELIRETTCAADTAASVEITVSGEAGRMFQVQWSQVENTGGSVAYSDTSAWYPAGIIELDQVFKFDNENLADKHYEVTVVDNMGCTSDSLYEWTFDDKTDVPVELTITVGVVNDCTTDVTLSAAGNAGNYTFMVDDVVVEAGLQMLSGGEHVIYVEDMNGCWDADTITLAYPMSMDTTLNTYVGEAVQFEYADAMLDTMLYAGEYLFTYAVDSTCTNALNVTVIESPRTAPVLDTMSPMDTIADNHPTFEIVFEGPVTFNDSVMGYLTVTPEDTTEAVLMIEITSAMVSGNTITVDYVLGDGELGLDKNTTYVVAVDSGVVWGDGLTWDGVTPDWMFTTGPDFATGIDNGLVDGIEFKVYPNPFNDHIKIDNFDKLTRVVITNIAGQRVLDIEYPSYEIRTGNLVTGVYVVTLITDDKIVKSERIIKR